MPLFIALPPHGLVWLAEDGAEHEHVRLSNALGSIGQSGGEDKE